MGRPLRVQLLAVMFASVACGGATGSDAPDAGAEASAECTLLPELALSPRPDAEAEKLAFRVAGTLTAPTDVYDRIRADLALIRAQVPDVAGIVARKQGTNVLSMGIDDVGFAAMNAGTYTAWDCVNARYGSSGWDGSDSKLTPTNIVSVRFGDRRLNIALVVEAYSSLPHRTGWIGSPKLPGDGNDVCAARSGDTYSYVFKKGEGDCPSGCSERTFWGFSTSPGTVLKTIGKQDPGASAPAWVLALPMCKFF